MPSPCLQLLHCFVSLSELKVQHSFCHSSRYSRFTYHLRDAPSINQFTIYINLHDTSPLTMDNLKADSKPSSINILRKFYLKVVQLNEYLQQTVSEGRYARI